MKDRKPRPVPAHLDQIRKQFARWRRSRHGRNIPSSLWDSASRAASEYGVSFTARVLGLNPSALKKRMQSSDSVLRSSAPDPAFVELVSAGPGPECTIELEDAQGSKMRVVVTGAGAPDVLSLVDRFWQIEA